MAQKAFSGGRALLVGIGQGYRAGLRLPPVVRADAEALGRILTDPNLCGYPDENVQLLLDQEAIRENIVGGLNRLVESAASDDTVLIFFSGHGGQRIDDEAARTYLCPADYDLDDPEGTGIEANEFSELIAAIPSARVVVIIDACHAAGVTFLKSYVGTKGISHGFRTPALEKLASGNGRVVVASCRDDEQSATYSEKGHSLFTYFVLEGLRGNAPGGEDGLVRVFDLFDYVSHSVPMHQLVAGVVQHPVIIMRAENNFPLALRKGGWFKGLEPSDPATKLKLHTSGTEKLMSLDLRRFERVLSELYPSGPLHNGMWSRAGGNESALVAHGSGRAIWHQALKMVGQGGGGPHISLRSLLEVALDDFPNNPDIQSIEA